MTNTAIPNRIDAFILNRKYHHAKLGVKKRVKMRKMIAADYRTAGLGNAEDFTTAWKRLEQEGVL